MGCYKALRLDCEMSVEEKIAVLIRKRCVGSLDGDLVYFIPASNKSFYLVTESSPRHFRKLSAGQHQRFKEKSRVENAGWQ